MNYTNDYCGNTMLFKASLNESYLKLLENYNRMSCSSACRTDNLTYSQRDMSWLSAISYEVSKNVTVVYLKIICSVLVVNPLESPVFPTPTVIELTGKRDYRIHSLSFISVYLSSSGHKLSFLHSSVISLGQRSNNKLGTKFEKNST